MSETEEISITQVFFVSNLSICISKLCFTNHKYFVLNMDIEKNKNLFFKENFIIARKVTFWFIFSYILYEGYPINKGMEITRSNYFLSNFFQKKIEKNFIINLFLPHSIQHTNNINVHIFKIFNERLLIIDFCVNVLP